MTRPKPLTLAPFDVLVDDGMLDGTGSTNSDDFNARYRFGLDPRGAVYLTYTSTYDDRPRLSICDPRWSPFHGLRYIEWVTP